MFDDVLLIDGAAALHLSGILLSDFKCLLSCDLQIEHVFGLLLFFLQLLKEDFGVIALRLQLVLQFHRLLSLGLKELSFLVSISDTTALNLVLELHVFFIYASLLSQGVLNALVAHSHLIFKIADARLGNGNVDLDETRLLAGLHRLSLCLFGQVAVVKLTCLHILGP